MIEEFITTTLLLVLGYAYPAFQCFKTVDSNRVDVSELRFWCQYWIVVAVITVLEKIGDVFISWMPMYGEMKLALFIYLWFPETKGTGFVYEKLLQPYVSRHETDIDRNLIELRHKAWNLTVYYWNNCTELGSTKILEFLQFVGSQTSRVTQPDSFQDSVSRQHDEVPLPFVEDPINDQFCEPPPPPTRPSSGVFGRTRRQPYGPFGRYRNQAPKIESIKVQVKDETRFVRPEDVMIKDSK